jgi:hypothetical protein
VPTVSNKQERFMQAVAHNPKFAKKVGVSQSVGREFTKAGGGEMKESKAMMKKEVGFMKKKGAPKSMIKHEMAEAGMRKGGTAKYAKGGMTASKMGAVRTAAPSRDGVAERGKTRGKQVVMAGGKGMKSGGMSKKYC